MRRSIERLGMGLVGPGFIAKHHLDAVRRLGDVEIIGFAGSSRVSAEAKSETLKISRVFENYDDLINDPRIQVIHNTTPNYLHVPITLAAIKAGKHVISDKPLAMTSEECAQLSSAAVEAGVVNAVTFNYRGNPLVQEARVRVKKGSLGRVTYIHGEYLQDWMADPNVYSWRMDPAKCGRSSALADIGSHWCDLAEYISGTRIVSVLADLATVVKTRYKPMQSTEAFARTSTESNRHAVQITAEDLATVLLRFENGARGCVKIGQVLPGHKNDLRIELNGRQSSIRWQQEEQNTLWLGYHDEANTLISKDPSLLDQAAAPYAHLPAGHQEGWADAFCNVIADIYTFIRSDRTIEERPATLCTFEDATRISHIIEAMLRSAERGGIWTALPDSIRNDMTCNQTTAFIA